MIKCEFKVTNVIDNNNYLMMMIFIGTKFSGILVLILDDNATIIQNTNELIRKSNIACKLYFIVL